MNNKQAGIGIFITITLLFLTITGIIVAILIANEEGVFNSDDENTNPPTINLYIKARDKNNFTNANYVLDYNQNPPTIISEGELSPDEWTEIKSPLELIHLYCWNNENYVVKASKIFSPPEIKSNTSKLICDMPKIGNITVSSKGKINHGLNLITLNITSEGWYYKPALCLSWTAGITSVSRPEYIETCNKGDWVNYSYFNASSQEYTYLNPNFYRCGNCQGGSPSSCERVEECKFVEQNKCKLFEMDVPYRYKTKVDDCSYLGSSLNNESRIVEFEVKADNPSELDEVTFYIFDRDRRFSPSENMWVFMSEYNEKNIGNSQDIVHIVK